jgi:virginiamycin B lyase
MTTAASPPARRRGPLPRPRRQPLGRVTTALLALAAAGLTACGSGGADAASPAPSPTSPAIVDEPLPAANDVAELGGAAIPAAPFPDWAMTVDDTVWVSGVEPGIVGYDAGTGAQRAAVPLDGEVLLAMEQGLGALWAAEGVGGNWGTTLLRIDPESGAVTLRAAVPGTGFIPESSLAIAADAVWGITGEGADERELIGIDPGTGEVTARYPAPQSASAVRAGFDSLWISTATGSVVRVSPEDGEVEAEMETGHKPTFLAVSRDAVWVVNADDGTLSRIDPAADEVVATVRVSEQRVQGGDVVATDDEVWVRTSGELAVAVDPATDRVVRRLGPAAGSGSVAVAGGAVWLTAHDTGTVHRVPLG